MYRNTYTLALSACLLTTALGGAIAGQPGPETLDGAREARLIDVNDQHRTITVRFDDEIRATKTLKVAEDAEIFTVRGDRPVSHGFDGLIEGQAVTLELVGPDGPTTVHKLESEES